MTRSNQGPPGQLLLVRREEEPPVLGDGGVVPEGLGVVRIQAEVPQIGEVQGRQEEHDPRVCQPDDAVVWCHPDVTNPPGAPPVSGADFLA